MNVFRPFHSVSILDSVCLLLPLFSIVMYGTADPLSWPQAVEQAMQNNPWVAQYEQAVARESGATRQVRAQAGPQVAFSSRLSESDNRLLETIFPGAPIPNSASWSAGVRMDLELYSGGRQTAQETIASLRVLAADSELLTMRQQVLASLQAAWVRIARARAEIQARQAAVERAGKHLSHVENLFAAGKAIELDRARAEAALAEVVPELRQAENQLRVETDELMAILGVEVLQGSEGSVELEDLPGVAADFSVEPSINVGEWVDLALRQRHELQTIRLWIEASDATLWLANASKGPSLQLHSGYSLQGARYHELDGAPLNGWDVGISLQIPIYDHGKTRAFREEAEAERHRLLALQQHQRIQIRNEVKSAIYAVENAMAASSANTTFRLEARRALRHAQEQLHSGTGLQIDVLDAEARLVRAEVSWVRSRYDLQLSRIRLMHACGMDMSFPVAVSAGEN